MLSYCTRIAARPPLSQPDSRRSAVTITHGPNDEFPLQGCTREHLLEDAVWGLPHAAVTTNHEQQANLEPCTPALTCYSHSPTLMQSARPETSRFPMTRTAPRFAPASTSAQRTPELRTDLTSFSRRRRARAKSDAGLQTLIFDEF